MLQRHADEQQQQQAGSPRVRSTADGTSESAYSGYEGGSGGNTHPLLAAVQARLVRQAEEVHTLYADACLARDRLLEGPKVRIPLKTDPKLRSL